MHNLDPNAGPVDKKDSAESPVAAPEGVQRSNFFRSYWSQARQVLLTPKQFFQQMPTQGGFVQPALFLLASALVYAILQAIAKLSPVVLLSAVFSSIIGVIIASALLAFVCKRLAGQGNFESTFRVLAYSKATLLFAWLTLGAFPIGGIASIVYGAYLNVIGLHKVHQIGVMKTTTAVVILTLVGILVKMKTGF